ncbi:MAG: hypothetical protein Q9209_007791 [Squamulea sp. 1 TL-2023]
MAPSLKPTKDTRKESQISNMIGNEEDIAEDSCRTRSRRTAPKNQPSLSASNRPASSAFEDPRKADLTNPQISIGALDQLSDIYMDPSVQSSALRKKSISPTRAGKLSPSKKSSLAIHNTEESLSMDGSQDSKGSKAVTKKDSLALMNPPVLFTPFGNITQPGRSLPPLAQQLWMDFLRSASSSTAPSIPDTLKVGRLDNLSGTPSGRHVQIAPNAFCTPVRHQIQAPQGNLSGPFSYHPADHEMIGEHVFDIHRMADLWRNKCHEDFWIEIVVAPLVHLVRKLTNFHIDQDKKNSPRISVINLKTSEIKPTSLISTSSAELFRALNKKIDMTIGLNLFEFQQEKLQRRQYKLGPAYPSINQVQSYFPLVPMFVNIEVKKKYQNRDPLIQLGAWVAAEFNKRRAEGWSLEMPVVAIAIDQDEWQLYIVHYVPKEDSNFDLRFVGPRSAGNTSDYEGIFRILYVLCTLAKWGEEVYRKWFYEVHGLKDNYEE